MRRKRPRRRLCTALHRRVVLAAIVPDQRWGMDFIADHLADGAKIRMLTIVDHFSRESPAIVVGRRLQAEDVVREFERLRLSGRKPHTITMDNASSSRSCSTNAPISTFIESFNGKLREECLNANWFETIDHARREIEAWRLDYNRTRPHGSLGELTPREFRQRWTSQQGGQIEVGI
jgi:putative transposase